MGKNGSKFMLVIIVLRRITSLWPVWATYSRFQGSLGCKAKLVQKPWRKGGEKVGGGEGREGDGDGGGSAATRAQK